MKKTLFFLMALALFVGRAIATPVDVDHAQHLGLKFMQNNFAKQVSTIHLAYTQQTESGLPALFVFNADNGFVIVAADDVAQPILGYSAEGTFDPDNLPDGLAYMLRHYARQIEYAVENQLEPEPEIAAQWDNIGRDGLQNGSRATATVPPLFDLRWNQDCYYNELCPNSNHWLAPCGHVYAGCAATAMSMVMKYWNWPDHGSGSHSYVPSGYSQQSADFENTYYDWNNMPISLGSGSTSAQIQAVARLMWHCGIAVDMKYSYTGSGASPYDVPDALKNYFRYTDAVSLQRRNDFSKTQWEDMLINSLDRGIPCFYAGYEGESGHAFVCLGYDNNRRFFFNWGWSNQYNSYYAIDALNTNNGTFNENQSAVFNVIPDYIYSSMMTAVTDLRVESVNAHSKTGVISWTNPTVNLGGATVENIEKVVLMRNGVEIFSQANATPGQAMTFEDNVPEYDCYTYTVYCLSNNAKGPFASTYYQYGPTCTWRVIVQTTNFQGWNGGKVQMLNAFGSVFAEVTMTNATPASVPVRVPEGNVSFKWVAPVSALNSVSIIIKNSENVTVYNYSGNSNSLPANMYSGTNECSGCLPPTGLNGEYQWTNEGFGTLLTWDYDGEPQSFKVYRSEDGVNYQAIATVNKAEHTYFDAVGAGNYYYQVTAFRSYCESTPAWASEDQDFVHVDVTSVNENDEDGCQVYPNPADAMVCVEAEGLEQVTIFNVFGQVVCQQRCNEDGVVIGTSGLSTGVYFMRVKSAQNTMTKRFSVVH